MTLPLSTDELAEVRCAARSGIPATPEQTLRLLATVDALQAALTMRQGRVEDVGEVGS